VRKPRPCPRFVAEKALAAARGAMPPAAIPLREALAGLTRGTAQVQKENVLRRLWSRRAKTTPITPVSQQPST
jgi:hypothetical protein